MCVDALGGQKRVFDSLKLGLLIGGRELPDVGARNQNWVLCKSRDVTPTPIFISVLYSIPNIKPN